MAPGRHERADRGESHAEAGDERHDRAGRDGRVMMCVDAGFAHSDRDRKSRDRLGPGEGIVQPDGGWKWANDRAGECRDGDRTAVGDARGLGPRSGSGRRAARPPAAFPPAILDDRLGPAGFRSGRRSRSPLSTFSAQRCAAAAACRSRRVHRDGITEDPVALNFFGLSSETLI
jgi:hypothetical protein